MQNLQGELVVPHALKCENDNAEQFKTKKQKLHFLPGTNFVIKIKRYHKESHCTAPGTTSHCPALKKTSLFLSNDFKVLHPK